MVCGLGRNLLRHSRIPTYLLNADATRNLNRGELRMINFDNCPTAKGVFYGGNAGAKRAVIYDNSVWMLKYPKTTRDMTNPQISYTSSPLSEHLGSLIYKSLGLPTHDTLLGISGNKVVVACRDFTYEVKGSQVVETSRLIHFHHLKNSFMTSSIDDYSGTGSETFLDEVLATIAGEETLSQISGVSERFWTMFVIDAFIGNNDRNNDNWGVILDKDTGMYSLAPVYDNGNAFFNKRSLAQMEKRIQDIQAIEEDACNTLTSVYKYTGLDKEGTLIKPFQYIREGSSEECAKALRSFLASVKREEIEEFVAKIPSSVGNLNVMPETQKDFYIALLRFRLEVFRKQHEQQVSLSRSSVFDK